VLAKGTNRQWALGVVGSPRRGGNTEILVDEVLRGAQDAGAHTEKIILDELDIAPCRACDRCVSTGECAQDDDLAMLLEQMRRSQIWVLGTPVYWSGPTAQFKAFLDRWYSARRIEFGERRAILVVSMGEPDASYADCTVETIRTALAYLKIEPRATILASDLWDLGEVREHPDVVEAAYRAGREAVTGDLSRAGESAEQPGPFIPEPDVSDEATLWIDDLSKMTGPRLIVTGAPIPLPKEDVLIGRVRPEVTPLPDVDLVPHGGDQLGVSRQHARMVHGSDGWLLEDLGSTNGTFLNGERVSPGRQVRVHTGDIIRLGMLTVIFHE
jgi:NAD(P)H-dependent FMN reductase